MGTKNFLTAHGPPWILLTAMRADLQAIEGERFLTADETAALLRISSRLLAKLVAGGKIPSVRIGARRLFDRSDLERWFQERKAASLRRCA